MLLALDLSTITVLLFGHQTIWFEGMDPPLNRISPGISCWEKKILLSWGQAKEILSARKETDILGEDLQPVRGWRRRSQRCRRDWSWDSDGPGLTLPGLRHRFLPNLLIPLPSAATLNESSCIVFHYQFGSFSGLIKNDWLNLVC